VLALAGMLLATGLGRFRQQARCSRFISDIRGFAAAFENVRRQSGQWPATPEGAGPSLARSWRDGSPFGGEYGWVPPARSDGAGSITLTAFSPGFPLLLSIADLRRIDARMDDGNLATGRFRTGFNGWPVYLVEVPR
jgi:type II secretory pathway pseudopilin PulG